MFTILIPTWNNLPYLKICVESIEKNSTFTHQIVVHVNEGNDGTKEWLEEKNIEYTFSEENIGICKALNISSELSKTDYICYFNDDMYALPGWDFHIYKFIESLGHQQFFVSGTMIEPKQGKNKNMFQGFDFGDIQNFKEKQLIDSFSTMHKKNWNGASWPPNVVHKSLWKKVGGYSEEFSPGMYSDPDFSMKLWQEGVRTFVGIGESKVYHFMSKSTGKITRNDGRTTFIDKWQITPGYFYRKMLNMGEVYNGVLSENIKGFEFWLMKLKIIVKKIVKR